MNDDYIETNIANDDWNHGTGTYDDIKAGNNRDIGSGPVEKPGIENDHFDEDGKGYRSILINNGDSNVAENKPEDMIPEENLGRKYTNSNLWSADKLREKMGENMAISEALIDEHPLRTENTPKDANY